MGRPIKKKWFGDPASPGYQIEIYTKTDTDYIVSQEGTRRYITKNNGIVPLVNKTSAGELEEGEAMLLARNFKGEIEAVSKLTQYRVYTWKADGTATSYKWTQDKDPKETGEAKLFGSDNVSPPPPAPLPSPEPEKPTPEPEPMPEPTPEPTPEPDVPEEYKNRKRPPFPRD